MEDPLDLFPPLGGSNVSTCGSGGSVERLVGGLVGGVTSSGNSASLTVSSLTVRHSSSGLHVSSSGILQESQPDKLLDQGLELPLQGSRTSR